MTISPFDEPTARLAWSLTRGLDPQHLYYPAAPGVMVLRLSGWIGKREQIIFSARLDQVLADPGGKTIIIDADSPGGSVYGAEELSAKIFRARGRKHIVGIVNSIAAGCSYWILSACGELSITPGGETGGIGVAMAHEENSAALARQGLKYTIIRGGKFKAEANPWEPLPDSGRAAMQARVNDYYDMFTRGVSRNRNTTVDIVRSGYSEGRIVGACEALANGMVDRIESMDQLLERLDCNEISNRRTLAAMTQTEINRALARPRIAIEGVAARINRLSDVPKPVMGDWSRVIFLPGSFRVSNADLRVGHHGDPIATTGGGTLRWHVRGDEVWFDADVATDSLGACADELLRTKRAVGVSISGEMVKSETRYDYRIATPVRYVSDFDVDHIALLPSGHEPLFGGCFGIVK